MNFEDLRGFKNLLGLQIRIKKRFPLSREVQTKKDSRFRGN